MSEPAPGDERPSYPNGYDHEDDMVYLPLFDEGQDEPWDGGIGD